MADHETKSPPPAEMATVLAALQRALYNRRPRDGAPPESVRIDETLESGEVQVTVAIGDTAYQLTVPSLREVAMALGPPLEPPREPLELPVPYRPRTSSALTVRDRPCPDGESLSVVRAGEGAQQAPEIVQLCGARLAAAAYTSRGPTEEAQRIEYKPFNEDGLALRLSRRSPEILSAGVFDQAGGEGAIAHRHGAASDLAAQAFDAAVARIEVGIAPEQALREAVVDASKQVQALGVGAVATFAAAVVLSPNEGPCRAHVMTLGDSRVLLVAPDGTLRRKTELHNVGAEVSAQRVPDIDPANAIRFAAMLTRGLGTQNEEPSYEEWELSPGDQLVLSTDGLGDARELEQMPPNVWHADRAAEDHARIVAATGNPAEAVTALVGYALDQMESGYGKPDNLAVVVLRLDGHSTTSL